MPAPLAKYRWTIALLLAVVVGMLAWPWAAAGLARRTIELSFLHKGGGPVSLRWSSAEKANGIWIDLDDPKFPKPRDGQGRRTCTLVQDLPSYAVERLELTADEGSAIEGVGATIRTRVVGIRAPSRTLQPVSAQNTVEMGALPPLWRATVWPGTVLLAGLAAGVVGVWALVRWLVRRYDSWFTNLPDSGGPTRKGLRQLVLLVPVCGIPTTLAVVAPMFILADSTAYVWFAHLLLKTSSLMHFDGWRLPGYALVIALAMPKTTDYALWVGALQAAMAIATPLLVYKMLSGRIGRWTATVAAVLVAVDPILMGWQRVLMPETLSALLIILAAWLFLRLVDRKDHRLTLVRSLALGGVLGLVCGAACVVRGNNQVVPAVLIVAIVWCGVLRRHWSLLASTLTVALGTVALMLPLCFINQQNHGRFSFAVGRDFTRSLFSWENETTDWNQCGTLSFDEFRTLRDKLRTEPMTDWDVMEWLGKTRTVPVPEGSSRWLAQEIRCGALVNETLARRGPRFTIRQLQAMTILLGVPITEPYYGVRGTWAVFTQLRGRDNHRTTSNFDFRLDRFPPDMQETLQRSIHDVGWLYQHPLARVYGAWFNLWRWLRILLAVGFLFSVSRLLIHRQWAMAALGLVVLANIVGVPALTYAAEYRYAAPYYPLMAVVIVYGLTWRGAARDGRNL